ncbi:hypothetical protein [Paenibacillus luteus]|nr:hypothetical protein [Paenibacillus luteus]
MDKVTISILKKKMKILTGGLMAACFLLSYKEQIITMKIQSTLYGLPI